MNGEGCSNLKQIVKENVRAVLSEDKQTISLSFAILWSSSRHYQICLVTEAATIKNNKKRR
jgi:hypothetical protein